MNRSKRSRQRRRDSASSCQALRNRSGRLVNSPWFLLAGAVIALLSLLAALIGPVPDRTKDETETSSLVAQPINKHGVTKFVLPFDAPLEDVPPNESHYCFDPALDWLGKYGTEVPEYQRIALRSTAEDGAMLSLTNVRATDLRRYDAQPVIYFDCPDAGAGDSVVLHLRLDRSAQAERVDPDTGGTGPFVFNLQPGEQGSIELHLLGDEAHSYSGRIVADVSVGNKTETVALPLNGKIDGFDRISPGKFARLVVSPGKTRGNLFCMLYPAGKTWWDYRGAAAEQLQVEVFDCTPEQVRSILAEIASSP